MLTPRVSTELTGVHRCMGTEAEDATTFMLDLIYPIATVLLGYIVLGITGFGSALMIVPLLSWQWPLVEVVALVLLLDVPASFFQAGLNMQHVAKSELKRLLPGLVVGAVLGLWLTRVLEPRWPLLALGVYVMSVGIANLRPHRAKKPITSAYWSSAAGVLIGMIEMLFGTAGPAIVAWLQRRLSDVHALRATTSLVIAISACAVLATMGVTGRLSSATLWWRWCILIGVALVGVAIGNRLARQISPLVLKKIICTLLVMSGLALTVHAAISS